jgi:hypothetical protein
MLDTVTPARENVYHPLGKVITTLGEEAELSVGFTRFVSSTGATQATGL